MDDPRARLHQSRLNDDNRKGQEFFLAGSFDTLTAHVSGRCSL
jgi:hypothetical protein